MARDISVELSVEGEREFNRQLKEAQSAVKVLGSELKASEAQFKGGENAQERYANRTRILGDQIEQERIIIERLTKAVEKSGSEFGETDAKTDKYRIALNRAKESVEKMKRQLEETDREMEELGRDSVRVGRQLENGIGESAQAASGGLEKMIKGFGADFKGMALATGISAAIDIGRTLFDVGQGIAEFSENTRNSRRQFGFLKQNAEDAGLAYQAVLDQVKEITALTGDEDSAIEGVSDLMAAGFDGRELAEAVDLLGGAVIRFPETLKFESLADSLQETVKTGEATGAYAELLGRLGVNVEDFNEAMKNAKTEEERQQIALAYLSGHGLKDTKEGYEEANQSMIDAEEAAFDLNQAMNGLGEEIEPIGTAFTNLATTGVKLFTKALDETGVSDWITGVLNDFNEAIKIISEEGLEAYGKHEQKEREAEYTEKHEAAADTAPKTAEYLEALRAELEKVNAEIDAAYLAGDNVKANTLLGQQSTIMSEIGKAEQAVFDVNEAKTNIKELGTDLENLNAEITAAHESGDTIREEALTKKRDEILADIEKNQQVINNAEKDAAEKMTEMVKNTMTEGMGEAGTEGNNELVGKYAENNESMYTAGYNKMASAASGIRDGGDLVVAEAEAVTERTNRAFARMEATPTYRQSGRSGGSGGGQSSAANRSVTVALNVDGRKFASATVPYVNAAMGGSLNAMINA